MRKHILKAKSSLFLFAMIVVLVCSSSAFAGATITIVNLDGPGEGFNDPTPAAPVGGNAGTTLGQQRLIAFQHAAEIWGSTLDSNVEIRIQAAFNPLAAGVLGSAGALFVFRDFGGVGLFPGAEFPATWYGSALADKRAGTELNPGFNDINAQFSSNFNFYLGLDNNHGAQPDLVVVLLHEFAHGLNFQTFVNSSTGANFAGFTDIYARHLLDTTTGLHWNEMTQAERQAAATKFGRIVLDAPTVTAAVPSVLVLGSPAVRVNSPAAIAGPYQFGTAAFGPPLGSPNVTANVVAAVDPADAAGPATTDGCSAFTNAAAVAGNIALIERGTCGFALKARNATNAGAAGVIIYNNVANAAAGPPGMADDGVNGAFVTIPTVSLARADGLGIVAQLGGGVNASLIVDPTIRAGADALNRARVFAPFPVAPGSSISHYDTVARRNLLMEPAINGDLTHNVKAPDDLTLELFRDVGWFPDADLDGVDSGVDCEPNSDLRPTVNIESCDSGVPNTLFENGCTISDLIAHIAANSRNHGKFVSGVAKLTNFLVIEGTITLAQKDAIMACAGSSNLP
jgi:PA domain